MNNDVFLRVGTYKFALETAIFRYITDSSSGPGWDFSFFGPCLNPAFEFQFDYGVRLLAEAAPLPLENADDLTGKELYVELPYYEATEEPYFGLTDFLHGEHDVSELTLRFLERRADQYLIQITATVAETLTGKPEPLELLAWATQQPNHAYPT